jgi:hypothetical protein
LLLLWIAFPVLIYVLWLLLWIACPVLIYDLWLLLWIACPVLIYDLWLLLWIACPVLIYDLRLLLWHLQTSLFIGRSRKYFLILIAIHRTNEGVKHQSIISQLSTNLKYWRVLGSHYRVYLATCCVCPKTGHWFPTSWSFCVEWI